MAQWFDLGLATANAVALGFKYGLGPVKSGAEVADFAAAMRGDGAAPADVCVLAAWLGGAAETVDQPSIFNAFNVFSADQKQSAAEVCHLKNASGDVVAKAWMNLHALTPMLATVVNIKASAKAARSADQLDAKTPATVKQWYQEVKRASQGASNIGKDAAAAVIKEAASVASSLVKAGAQTVVDAVSFGLALQADTIGSIAGSVLGAIPWFVWAGLGVAAIGGIAYFTAPFWGKGMLAKLATEAAAA